MGRTGARLGGLTRVWSAATLVVAGLVGGVAPAGTVTAAPAAAPATLSVTPSTGLVDGQIVTVSGIPSGGFESMLTLCVTASVEVTACTSLLAEPGSTGAATVVRLPARFIAGDEHDEQVTDCRVTSCSIRTWDWSGDSSEPSVSAQKVVTFDPAAPLRPAPAATITPSTALVDGQTVHIDITGEASPRFIVLQCTEPLDLPADIDVVPEKCDVGRAEFPEAGTTGSVSGEVTVSAYIQTAHGPLDCRAPGATCVLSVIDQVFQNTDLPLVFDPDGPVIPAMLERPVPSESYSDTSTFDLVGFTPGDPFTVRWCNAEGACLAGTVASGTLDASGIGTFTISDDDFPEIAEGDDTCAESCDLMARDAHGLTAHGGPSIGMGIPIPLPFESDRLPVTVTPRTGLRDGQQVTVTASGFIPGAQVALIQCTQAALASGIDGCDLDTSTFLGGNTSVADANGRIRATFTVRRHITVNGERVDCAQSNIDPDAWAKGIAEDPSREKLLDDGGWFTCIVGVADVGDYSRSGGSPIAFEGAVFRRLPWERDDAPTRRAPVATPVVARPAYTG